MARILLAFFLLLIMTTITLAQEVPITGADQTEAYLPLLKDKRVGLVGNPSSIIRGQPSLDVLVSMNVKLVKCFGPEHGFRGQASNGAAVGDEVDAKTGIPLISLYGQRKGKPTDADMGGIDVMLYDIQDVGTRFYTNINILRNVMDACAAHDIPLILLDRPNPSAYLIDGPILDMKFKSGVGQFPIPIAYGMTPGEFAMMINGEGWLAEGKKCNLKVIRCANYTHDTPYELPVHPSPNLNTQQSVMLYPSLCLFEGTIINLGRGTQMPFTVLGAPALKGKYDFSFTPKSIPGMSEHPLHENEACYGLDLRTYDIGELRQSRRINLSWMIELYKAYPDKARFFDRTYSKQIANIDLLAGTSEFKRQIQSGLDEWQIRESWEPGLREFKKKREKYLLYPEYAELLITSRDQLDAHLGQVVTIRGEFVDSKTPSVLGVDVSSNNRDLKVAEARGVLQRHVITEDDLKRWGNVQTHGPGTYYRLKALDSENEAAARAVSSQQR